MGKREEIKKKLKSVATYCADMVCTESTQGRIMSRLRSKCFSFESWVDLNWKMGKRFESWIHLNQYLGNPLESWVDSELIPWKPLESWVESIQVFEILLKSWADLNQGTWVECPKRSTKLSGSPKKVNEIRENPKKVNEINSWSESLSHDLIRINIPDSFFTHESI